MEKIKLEDIVLDLTVELGGIRVISREENTILKNQSIENISALIIHNFSLVKNHYEKMANQNSDQIKSKDINNVSLSVTLYFLYMYNSWQSKQDLVFKKKDFDAPSAHDIIFSYFSKNYPENWKSKSAILLGMNLEEVCIYYEDRKKFYYK